MTKLLKKNRTILGFFVFFFGFLVVVAPSIALAQTELMTIEPDLIDFIEPIDPLESPGYFVDAVGTYFEVTNNLYLNITLTSSETVHVFLESIPGMVSFVIESNNSATTTVLTISGFEADTMYYKYQDGTFVESFTTDSLGRYTYTQDISQSHYIIIQESKTTIYINPDGTVTPSTAPISVVGNVYTFTSDIYEPIFVQRDNIVIDGNGYTLQGSGTAGIWLWGVTNVTVKNTIVKDFTIGIALSSGSNNNTISGNTVYSNVWGGIVADGGWGGSIGNKIFGNTVYSHYMYGIALAAANGNTVSENTVSGSEYGIWLFLSSSNNIISENNVSNNRYGVYLDNTNDNSISGNTVLNNLYYGIWLWLSINNTLSGNTASGNMYGIHIVRSDGNVLNMNGVSNNSFGIYIHSSNHNSMSGNVVSSNNRFGISLWLSSSNTLSGNIVSNNRHGIYLAWYGTYLPSGSNILRDNAMTSNDFNFGVTASSLSGFIQDIDTSNTVNGKPIYYLINQENLVIDQSTFPDIGYLGLINSTNIEVRNLNLTENNVHGMLLAYTTNSILRNMNISNSVIGISLWYSSNNLVYHNNIIDNTWVQAQDSNPASNDWHHPILLEGNYWSDYFGMDNGSGAGKHSIAGDGIGDTQIPHPSTDYDYYPFVYRDGWIDTDGDGIPDWLDTCLLEDARGFDADLDGCIDTITGLNDVVENLPDDVLSDEIKTSLVSKVDNALKSVDKEVVNAAINKLEAFINEVEAQRGKKISEEAADMLIEYAQNIIAKLQAQLQ